MSLRTRAKLEEALRCYDAAIRMAPDLVRAHMNRGNVLLAFGNIEGALQAYATAIAKDRGYALAHYNMGMTYARAGRHGEARVAFESTLVLKPDFADAEVALGYSLEELGQLDAAAACYRRALDINPNYAEVHSNLGNVLRSLGQLDAALASYRRAIDINADLATAHHGLGRTLEDLSRSEDAVASYRRAVVIDPDYAEVHSNLANVLKNLGQLDNAAVSYRRALVLNPDFADAHYGLGNILQRLGQLDGARASYQRALELKPDFAEACGNLGNVLRTLGQFDEAASSYRRVLRINPNDAKALCNLGVVLQDLGQLDGAAASYRQALEIQPVCSEAYFGLLFCLSHNQAITSDALYAEHCRFGEQFEAPLRSSWPLHRNARDPNRCVQVGFVSGDLREHPVTYFFEPILAHLRQYDSLSLHAYDNHGDEDAATQRLRGLIKRWHPIADLSDATLAETIAADGIDILIDLSGHTGKNRLLTFARKPAPVQASWIGYPGTTGLAAMDYYICDKFFLPRSDFDSQFTEKLVYLPANAPFLPDPKAPAVGALPALTKGHLTFGSFNRLSKLSLSSIALWSRLLRALPDASIVLGGMPQDDSSNTLITWFAQEGIVRDRLSFHKRCDTATYLALHHQVDMCLDTFPYSGGTTTNHALWMGVPTLTLAGHTPPGRQGAAMLGQVGLEAFVAKDADDFLAKGLHWASDLAALAAVRSGLRQRIEQSQARRPEVIAAGFERALRTMWQRWCAGLPAVPFEVGQ